MVGRSKSHVASQSNVVCHTSSYVVRRKTVVVAVASSRKRLQFERRRRRRRLNISISSRKRAVQRVFLDALCLDNNGFLTRIALAPFARTRCGLLLQFACM